MIEVNTIQGVKIFLTDDGKFQATVRGETIRRSSIKAIENLIRKDEKPVPAYDLKEWRIKKPINTPIKSFVKDRARLENGKLAGRFEDFYLLTDKQLEELTEIYKQSKALDDQWRKILGKAKQITRNNIEEIRQSQS